VRVVNLLREILDLVNVDAVRIGQPAFKRVQSGVSFDDPHAL
jgi:hypothetical protein